MGDKPSIFLAIDYGAYEGWHLKKVDSVQAALDEVKQGVYGEWKILREVRVVAKVGNG